MRIKAKNTQGGWDTYCPHGIGDILETDNPTSPALRWPGTVWAAMAPGRVLVGVDPNDTDFNTPGKTGGSKTHTNTVAEMVNHKHEQHRGRYLGTGYNYPGAYLRTTGDVGGGLPPEADTGSSGGGQPYSIMNPYETVYRYKRTA